MATKSAIGIGMILSVLVVAGLLAAASGRRALGPGRPIEGTPDMNSDKNPMVAVHVFNSAGELIGPIQTPKVVLTDDEWRARLTPDQFMVLRSKGTERPFCGTLLDNKKQGVYTCAGCGLPLFSSDSKFQSGTGWPSFFQPIASENVVQHSDYSHGMVRTEIVCGRCEGHLGHVFEDGPRPTGLRFCLNSESLQFTSSDQLASIADPAANGNSGAEATAVFAGGCFWCTEAAFDQLQGVSDVTSGYMGGRADTANYEAVCTGSTGHAEAIRVHYDPSVITYDELLDVFFDAHDPTQLNRQGNDIGTQYRSAIFYSDDAQRQVAENKIRTLNAAGAFDSPIVTTLEKLTDFYPAEQYHQDYAQQNPSQPYIMFHSTPKVCKVREKHARLVRPESAPAKSNP